MQQEQDSTIPSGAKYEMNSSFIERKFGEGDTVVVRYRENPYSIILEKAADNVSLSLPAGSIDLSKGKEHLADLDGDGSSDLRIIVKDIDTEGKGAVIKFDRNTEAPAVVSSGISSQEELSDVSVAAVAATETAQAARQGTTLMQSRKESDRVIFESDIKEPFTVNLSFRGYCLMRYEADGGSREERYFHKGDTFRLDVSESIKIWLSNGAALTATVNNVEYVFGSAGAVSAKIIGWSEKSGGGYAVKAFPFY